MSELIAVAGLDDPRVEDYRHIADLTHLAARGLFVAEGRLVVQRLAQLPRWTIRSVLLTRPAAESLGAALNGVTAPIYLVDQDLMNGLAGFNIHRGCLALASRAATPWLADTALDGLRRVLVLEGVNNPDNVGGIFRSADAFGIDLVVLGPDCGDPLYRKAIRTSMASTLKVPYAAAGEWPQALQRLRDAGFTLVALTPHATATPLAHVPPALPKVALLAGAEGAGLSPAALDAAGVRARIPMAGPIDSLNVTTAASIAMYHFSQDARALH